MNLRLFALLCLAATSSAQAGLVNRWSFNNAAGPAAAGTTLVDSVSGAVATVRGINSTFTGTSISLTGTTTGNQTAATISGYVDLPNGLLSSKVNFSAEIWATPLSAANWMRVFDFGRVNTAGVGGGAAGEITGTTATAPGATSASDDLMLSFCRGTNSALQRLEMVRDGGNAVTCDSGAATTLGTQYHYVVTFEDSKGAYGSSGGQVSWYRDGVVIATAPVPYHLSSLEDVNNWLGRSMWTADQNANARFNEVRIYDHALSTAEILANRDAGPDTIVSTPPSTAPVVPPQPVNRWSFNNPSGAAASGTTFTDSIGSAVATLRGTGATFTGSAVSLPGTTNGNQTATAISAYLDLPNGLISSKPNLSVEAWATPLSSKTDQRLFDFGRSTLTTGPGAATGENVDTTTAPGAFNGFDNLVLSLNSGATFGKNRLEGEYNDAGPLLIETDLSSLTTAGTEYHYVITVENNAGLSGTGGCLARFYRNGALVSVLHLNFHLNQLADVNNWIGRSNYAADMNANVAINELRFYNYALSPAEITASYQAGAGATFGPPVTQPDSATIHAGQKVLLPVLANDTGSLVASTVQIVTPPSLGTATVDSAGRILYAHPGSSTAPVTFTYRVFGYGGYSAPQTVTIQIATTLRIPNSTFNVPASPPATAIQIVPAFPTLAFTKPLCFASPPGDTKRLFVCEIGGLLKCIPDVTTATPTATVCLDIPTMLANRALGESIVPGGDGECGLLGLAFHPNYAQNGYLFATYSVRKSTDTAVWYQRLVRFTVPAAQRTQPAPQVDPASELILLEQRDRDDNHNGGDLHFGADGYLYYAVGDEGNPNDHWNNSQRIDLNFFSAMLRLDVDKKAGNLEPNPHTSVPTDAGLARYSVPADNPFVGATSFNGSAVTPGAVRTEFWAVGLRSPWRFSFDDTTGELWLGDVGQDTYEEVDLITKGANYGWAFREGLHAGPKTPTAGFTSIDPIYEYVHNAIAGDSNFKGNAVIGGLVYRGTKYPSLTGAYIFGDQVSGNIWSLTRPGGVPTVTRIGGQANVVNFGTDPSNGDVLLSNYFGGAIMRLITTTPDSTFPTTLSATGLFADLTDLSPSPGLLPYTPNLTFWSDYAVKHRWFTIPDGTSKMTWSRDGNWTFPSGQIWVKHFDLETTRGNATSLKRIETRVLVRNDSGVYGVSYRWNDAQTEATLVADGGDDFGVNLTVNGSPYTQAWRIPSRAQCVTCHSPVGGGALSFNTRQLNRSNTINGFTGNQLDLLRIYGYFANTPASSNLLPRHLRADETSYPVEARTRSYFAVNCGYCHQPGGAGPAWDGRPELTLAQTGLINGAAATALHAGDFLVVPGDPTHSVVLNRIAVTNGYTRMPPLGSNELDPTAIALVTEWITQSLPTRQTYEQWRAAQFNSTTSPEGAPTGNADGDTATNYAEFLAATNPLNGASFPALPQLAFAGNTVTLSYNVPANRSVFIETSTDLVNWSLWDVPGNAGLPQPGGPFTLSGPMFSPRQFFRLWLQEN